MALARDTVLETSGAVDASTTQASRRRDRRRPWRHDLSLRYRLLLLVIASVVPLVGMGVVREYLDYSDEQHRAYDSLLTIARGMAVSVERDLQLRVSALETLALSPALQDGDLSQFDKQAEAFLARQPSGSVIGLAAPDMLRLRTYGLPPNVVDSAQFRESFAAGIQVFDSARPIVTNMHVGRVTGLSGFSVDVPVFRDGRVVYDLYIRLLPRAMADLIARQDMPLGATLTVVDASGTVVASTPGQGRSVGTTISPALSGSVSEAAYGLTTASAGDDGAVVSAYARVTPFGWTVIVGAPQAIVFGPLRAAILRVAVLGAIVLAAGVILALFASRGIIRPIAQLRRLAAHDNAIDPAASAATGLPETDTVARALLNAATERRKVSAELADSEQRFRALFERSPGGTVLLDPDTTEIIDCNAVAAGYVGYTVEELRGRPVTSLDLGLSHARLREMCRAVDSGQSLTYETRLKGRRGARDLLNAIAPVQVSGRTLVLINQTDVTDLRQAEAGVRVNEERLELAREGANLGIWDWDIINDTLTWSEQQWQLHGLPPTEHGPSPELWRHAVHPADLLRTQAELVTSLKSPDRPFATEYSVIMPDGSIRRLLGRGQAIRGPDGRALRMVGINMDVTARYEAEVARDRLIWMLDTERNRLAEIIEAMPVAVGIVDASGRVVLGNAMMHRLTGPVIYSMTATPRGEWIAHDEHGNRLAPENFPVRRALRLGEAILPGVEFLFRDVDGSENWFRVGAVPVRAASGEVKEALGIILDIDAEKRLRDIQRRINADLEQRVREEMAAREAAQRRAAHAERMHALGQIAGGIAHDFNNVLQAVSGGAALIERRPGDPERVLRNARMVLDAAKRGAAITSRLLAFSRRGDLRAENVDATALLTDMAEVLTHTLGGSVVCKVNAPIGLPPLFADRGQLETVLVNLATNARDAMPSGGTLSFAADVEMVSTGLPHPAGLTPGRYIRIVVSDTGTGMDASILARVTEPFFTTKEAGKGTGLGLAMAKGFVEQSGGSLSIDSVVDQGTRIILWLPSVTDVAGRQSDLDATLRREAAKPHVLLVDDDAIVRDVLSLSLEESGYRVHAAESGAAALALLEAGERVDIIVSDLTMPSMDGLMLIRSAQERRRGLPAVLLTGYAGDGAALAIGGAISWAFSLLRKPVSGAQLIDRISALLASRKQASNA